MGFVIAVHIVTADRTVKHTLKQTVMASAQVCQRGLGGGALGKDGSFHNFVPLSQWYIAILQHQLTVFPGYAGLVRLPAPAQSVFLLLTTVRLFYGSVCDHSPCNLQSDGEHLPLTVKDLGSCGLYRLTYHSSVAV